MQLVTATHTEDVESLAREAIRLCARALAAVDTTRVHQWEELGLTLQQLRFLYQLHERDGQCVTELADAMRVHPATITGLTNKLIRRRLVQRTTDRADRRVKHITLTPSGRSLVSADPKIVDRLRQAMREVGGSQLQSLMPVLREVSSRVATVHAS
jgi:MarR family transcriptional regulator, organic hydroperoxide resistance regulator